MIEAEAERFNSQGLAFQGWHITVKADPLLIKLSYNATKPDEKKKFETGSLKELEQKITNFENMGPFGRFISRLL